MNKRTGLIVFVLACIALIVLWLYTVPQVFGQTYEIGQDSTYTVKWNNKDIDGIRYDPDIEFVVSTFSAEGVTTNGVTDTSYTCTCCMNVSHSVQARYPGSPLSTNSNTVYVVMIAGEQSPPQETQIPVTYRAWDMRFWGNGLYNDILTTGNSIWTNLTVAGGTYEVKIYFVGHLRVNFGSLVYDLWSDNRLEAVPQEWNLTAGTYMLKMTALEDTRFHYGAENWTLKVDKTVVIRLAKPPDMIWIE
uniref:Uncharacterized protein n=2 Tax=viral metagenome TaxID=1070528 RepID=A0A6M3K4R0_9ZZZZ